MRMFNAAAWALNMIFSVISFCIIIDAFASWMPSLYSNPTVSKILYAVHAVVSPLINLSRYILSKISFFENMPVDISPIIALFLLRIIQWLVMQLLQLVSILVL